MAAHVFSATTAIPPIGTWKPAGIGEAGSITFNTPRHSLRFISIVVFTFRPTPDCAPPRHTSFLPVLASMPNVAVPFTIKGIVCTRCLPMNFHSDFSLQLQLFIFGTSLAATSVNSSKPIFFSVCLLMTKWFSALHSVTETPPLTGGRFLEHQSRGSACLAHRFKEHLNGVWAIRILIAILRLIANGLHQCDFAQSASNSSANTNGRLVLMPVPIFPSVRHDVHAAIAIDGEINIGRKTVRPLLGCAILHLRNPRIIPVADSPVAFSETCAYQYSWW